MDLLQQLYQLEFVCRKFWGNTTNERGLRSKRSASAIIWVLPRKKKKRILLFLYSYTDLLVNSPSFFLSLRFLIESLEIWLNSTQEADGSVQNGSVPNGSVAKRVPNFHSRRTAIYIMLDLRSSIDCHKNLLKTHFHRMMLIFFFSFSLSAVI